IWQVDGKILRCVAATGVALVAGNVVGRTQPLSRRTMSGRAILDARILDVEDVEAEENRRKFPDSQRRGNRTTMHVPMLRGDAAIGTIVVGHMEVRPFTAEQVDLLKTFADQAVIAIENARLFEELEQR